MFMTINLYITCRYVQVIITFIGRFIGELGRLGLFYVIYVMAM